MDPEGEVQASEAKIQPAETGRGRKRTRDVRSWKKTKEKLRRYVFATITMLNLKILLKECQYQ